MLSTAFVHGDVVHLVLNLGWTWKFGRILEPRMGSRRFLVLVLCLESFSNLACHALDRGGIGLSGVGYGLWALILVGGWRFEDLRGVLSRRDHLLFVVWFFVCLALTATKVWNVSNLGHAAGAVLGAAYALGMGHALALPRTHWIAGAMLAACLLAFATVLRDDVNIGGAAEEARWRGWSALERKEWPEAQRCFERATSLRGSEPDDWWRLGVALAEQGRADAARDACFTAFERGVRGTEQLDWLHRSLMAASIAASDAGRNDAALAWTIKASRVAPDHGPTWANIEIFALRLEDAAWTNRARRELERLNFGSATREPESKR